MFAFQTPLFLLLLIVVPVLILAQRRTHLGTTEWRKSVTFFLRGAALLCAIFALANLHRTDKEQRLAVVFLIDTSESVSPFQHEGVLQQINAAVAKLKPADRFGIIGFAREPSTLIEIRQKQDQSLVGVLETIIEQTVRRDGTDMITALKRAIAMLPDDYHRRIVLFSDGIHNAGGISLADYLPLLSASNVEILTIPIDTLNDAVQVVQLQVPNQVRKGQRFEIDALIKTDGSIPKLNATLYHEGAPIKEFEWTLPSGTRVMTLDVPPVTSERNHRYELRLELTDEIPENNRGYGVVKVQGRPHILYLESDQRQAENLKTVLEENGFDLEVRSPTEMPTELVELQRSDVLILSNVSADTLSSDQLQNIENYVRDLGHGFVVIGGEHAYGPGGYTGSALEHVLPVEMTPREQKDTVAVLFVLDTSGSMANYVRGRQKIQLAIEGVRTGIRNLDEQDTAGILGFNTDVHLISDLTSDHTALISAVSKLRPTGGTTQMGAATEQAYEMLTASEAKRKHIILLSDGKSDDAPSDFLELAEQIAEARISITAIAIGDVNRELLMQLTETGNGHFVPVQNLQELPIVLTEAVRETQRYIVQESFRPVIMDPSASIVDGLGVPPQLDGYTATTKKEIAQVFIRSHKDEPVLAGWNFGLGKSVAWTSDVKPTWSKEWILWENFGKFWGQVVNWVLPAAEAGADFDLVLSLQRGVVEVRIDARDPSQASYKVRVAGPGETSNEIKMQQVTSTRYSGTFQIQDSGSYIVTAQREGDEQIRTEVLSLPYPIEYAEFEVNIDLLKTLAADTAGIYQPTPMQIAAPAGVAIEKQVSLAQALLIAAALLFVLEMILRRYSIANRRIAELLGRLRGKKSVETQVAGTTTETVPSTERIREDTTTPQPTEASMTRLLAAKRRAR